MRRRGWYWPLAIVGLLAGSAGANLALVVIAARDASFAVEKDYYRKALAWDDAMAQERRNEALGWSVAVDLARLPDRSAEVRLTARVSDGTGAPLAGARVTVEALHNARASHVFAAALTPGSPGRYAATMPLARPGLWEVRVRVERGGDVFTRVVTRDLGRTT